MMMAKSMDRLSRMVDHVSHRGLPVLPSAYSTLSLCTETSSRMKIETPKKNVKDAPL